MEQQKGFIQLTALLLAAAILGGIAGALYAEKLVTSNQTPPPKQVATPIFGSNTFNATQAKPATLTGTGIGTTDVTINLSSFTTPQGAPISMSLIGSIGYATIDPGTTKEENISFTGITQNGNGTAQLTGVTRGLGFTYPYTASSSLRQTHYGGSKLITSNSAPFYSSFSIVNNDETISGQWIYNSSSIPRLSPDTTNAQVSANGQNLVNYNTLASTSFAGVVAANPDTNIPGIGMFSSLASTTSGVATSSYLGTTYYLFPQNRLFNTTSSATTTVPVTNVNGKLSQGFLDLTQQFTFSGGVSTTSNFEADGSANTMATTTFNQSAIFNNAPTGTAFTRLIPRFMASSTWAANNVSSTPMSFTLGTAGRLFISNIGSVSTGVGAANCGWDVYIDGATSTNWQTPVFTNPGSGNYQAPLTFTFITGSLSAAAHSINVSSSGATCASYSPNTNYIEIEYIGQ